MISKSAPIFSVVIPVCGRQKILQEALVCLQGQSLPVRKFEVLVVVNGGNKDEFAPLMLRMNQMKNLRFFFQREMNASLARNLGVAKARGSWMVFIDSDCHPHADWLENLHTVIGRNKKIRIIGGPILDYVPPGVIPPENYRLVGWDQSYGPKERLLQNHEFLMEGNLAIHKRILQKVGGFRADLGPGNIRFGFHEGTELQNRIRKIPGARQRILYSPRIPIRHVIRPGRTDVAGQLARVFLSGFDYAKAFPQLQEKSSAGLALRVLVQSFHYPLTFLFRRAASRRILFRLGELSGQLLVPYGIFPNHAPDHRGPLLASGSRRQGSRK